VPPLFLQFQFNVSSRRGTMPTVMVAALPRDRAELAACVEPVTYWRAYDR
jgi:hypothetical protein